MIIQSFAAADTLRLGAEMGQKANPGDIFCLVGALGMGKTVLAQGLAQGLGYAGRVTSPTFSLMNIYEGGRLTLYHFDLYRLAGDEVWGLGADEYFDAGGVCLLEWPKQAGNMLPDTARWIEIKADLARDIDYREIIIHEGSCN